MARSGVRTGRQFAPGPSVGLFLAAWAVLPAAAQTATRDIGPIVSYSGPDRTEKLASEAKKEGVVSLYSSATVEDMARHIKTFQDKYGVKVTLWRGNSEGIAQRAITEHQGGRDLVDAIETSGINLESLHRESMLQPVNAPIQSEIVPAGIAPHREYTSTRLQLHVNAYNTNLIKQADLPRTWDDLADPKWKGKLGIEADDGDWFGQVLHVYGEEKGLAAFRRIAANGVSVRKGHTLLANLIASGEVPLGMSVYEYKFHQMKAAGAPVDYFYTDPVMVHPVAIGILKAAPHPNAAALFFDFMLSDSEKIYMEQDHYPSNVKVKPLPQGVELHFMNFAQALDEQDKWTKIYKETFLSRAR